MTLRIKDLMIKVVDDDTDRSCGKHGCTDCSCTGGCTGGLGKPCTKSCSDCTCTKCTDSCTNCTCTKGASCTGCTSGHTTLDEDDGGAELAVLVGTLQREAGAYRVRDLMVKVVDDGDTDRCGKHGCTGGCTGGEQACTKSCTDCTCTGGCTGGFGKPCTKSCSDCTCTKCTDSCTNCTCTGGASCTGCTSGHTVAAEDDLETAEAKLEAALAEIRRRRQAES